MKVTDKQLEAVVNTLNEVTGNPTTTFMKTKEGLKPNKGNYHISHGPVGVCLHQMTSDEHTGVNDVFRCGGVTKRELFEKIHVFIDGIELGKELVQDREKIIDEIIDETEKQLATTTIVVTVVKDGVVDKIQKFHDVDKAEQCFLDECKGNISNFDEYTHEDINALFEDGYEKFGHGSVCISWI